jgi:hypothetical protein
MIVTAILIIVGIAAVTAIVASAFQFGIAIGKGQGSALLKKDINEMTVRQLLAHKRDNLENL